MTVKLSPLSVLAFVVGLGILVFMLSGKDLSPAKSVADSPHSVVNLAASSESAFEANRSTLRSAGPEQVTVVEPPTVIVNVTAPGNSTPTPDFGGDTGWRTPNPGLIAAAQGEEKGSEPAATGAKINPDAKLDTTQVEDHRAGSTDPHRFAMPQEDGSVFDPADYSPCASDDGSGPRPCFFDAANRGNGIGSSFFVAANGNVTQLG